MKSSDSNLSRRVTLGLATWMVPTAVIAVAAPAYADSTGTQPEHAGLNHNGSIRRDNVQANPRAWAWGNPGQFDAADGHHIRLTITITGAAAVAGHTVTLVDPATGQPSSMTQLNGWTILSSTATRVVLEWPDAVWGSGFNTGNVEWYFVEVDSSGTVIPGDPQVASGSVRVVGSITGTSVQTFDEGDLVGP